MKENAQTVEDLVARLRKANAQEFAVLERTLSSDTRITVKRALESTKRRIEAETAEQNRLRTLYESEQALTSGKQAVGLDEVGRGPLAGPLTIGAVVLDTTTFIPGLNDSKQVPEDKREHIAASIKECAYAYSIQHIEPHDIDTFGMSACLRKAFSAAIAEIDTQLSNVEVVLIDGNPLRIDNREINVVHGDATCASIAAASILAKVERDNLMRAYDIEYPQYGFASNKGYASAQHQEAIRTYGLTPLHRVSFCGAFLQQSLF